MPASMELLSLLQLLDFLKRMLSTITSLASADKITATLLELMHTKTTMQERANSVAKEEYRRRRAKRWGEEGLNFVITVLMALPALKHGESVQTSLIGSGYTFLFNFCDSLALPPHPQRHSLPPPQPVEAHRQSEHRRDIQQAATRIRRADHNRTEGIRDVDADAMHGLPVGIHLVGRRLDKEEVLEGMLVLHNALQRIGVPWEAPA